MLEGAEHKGQDSKSQASTYDASVQRKVVYPKTKALSKEANIVNNLMNHGLTAEEIVPALSMTPVEVNQLIERFELPRCPKGQRT